MRTLVLAAIAAVTIVGPVLAESSPQFSRRATEQYLRQLDTDQLRIVRRSVRSCTSITPVKLRPERNPCVISSTDKAVANADEPDLKVFHEALRQSDRYDENRTSAAWMIWLVRN